MVKRIFDIAVSSIAIILLSPVIGILFILIMAFLGGPVFFRQRRPGQNGRPFEMIKFRTMTSAADSHGQLLPDAERLTGFGRWLRATSLDELPELWNVLRGEMSLVGPRPLLMEYIPLYSPFQARRHEVAPGITGWAQIHGRNSLSWDEKFALDVWYVDNRTLWLDIKILYLTVEKTIRAEGITAPGAATMPAFTGQHLGHDAKEGAADPVNGSRGDSPKINVD